jgi:hypothetical protein
MSYDEILQTSDDGRYRVKLIADEDASEPYDDGQSPLLRFNVTSYGTRAEHIMDTGRPTDDDARIEEAAQRWGSPSGHDFQLFEKYLRAYYSTAKIETWNSGNYWYVTYDTAAWREYIGVPASDTVSWLASHSASINMDEYKAWCEGDCWGYAVERNVTWRRDDEPGTTMQTWEEEDSCWGYYGSDYAREEALRAFKSWAETPAPATGANKITRALADMARASVPGWSWRARKDRS